MIITNIMLMLRIKSSLLIDIVLFCSFAFFSAVSGTHIGYRGLEIIFISIVINFD